MVATGITSVLLSWYVGNFTDYNVTYGSLGALMGLLTWLWLTVTIIIFGAELNSEIEHQTSQDSTTGAELPLGERSAQWPIPLAASGPRPATRSKLTHPEEGTGQYLGA